MKIILKMFMLLVALTPIVARAEGSASGSDMWTRIFEQWGLFHPHANFCTSASEAFITISGSASQGFCIEKTERTAATWDVARDTCAADKKRLPEPGEWKFACVNGTGLSDMTDDYEWASNFPLIIGDYTGGAGLAAAKLVAVVVQKEVMTM
jgi:hypothetical protein